MKVKGAAFAIESIRLLQNEPRVLTGEWRHGRLLTWELRAPPPRIDLELRQTINGILALRKRGISMEEAARRCNRSVGWCATVLARGYWTPEDEPFGGEANGPPREESTWGRIVYAEGFR